MNDIIKYCENNKNVKFFNFMQKKEVVFKEFEILNNQRFITYKHSNGNEYQKRFETFIQTHRLVINF